MLKTIEQRERRKILLLNEDHPMRKKNKEIPPMLGKTHSEETKKRISESKKGRIPWNKGLKSKIN